MQLRIQSTPGQPRPTNIKKKIFCRKIDENMIFTVKEENVRIFLILNKKKNLHFWSKAKFLSTGVVQHQTIDEKIYIVRIFHPPVWPHCVPVLRPFKSLESKSIFSRRL